MPTLNWIGKEAVVNHHHQVPFHLLKDVPELACGDPGSGNLIVQGDNLVALKALLPYYAGQVKCIYIDPPYNTGNEGWIYNDNVNSPLIREWLGKAVGREAEDLSRHDNWLCMMYPRLALLRQFLREDGVIFVSIDDNEVANLQVAFGRNLWRPSFRCEHRLAEEIRSRQPITRELRPCTTIFLCIGTTDKFVRNFLPRTDEKDRQYKYDNDPRGILRVSDYTCNKTADKRPNLFYAITNPMTGEAIWPKRTRVWAIQRMFMQRTHAQVGFGGGTRGHQKSLLLSDYQARIETEWCQRSELGGRTSSAHNDEAKKEFRAILGTTGPIFLPRNPRNSSKESLQIAANPGDLILDSFAGSGTTGHAVLNLNKADGGNRKFILVEMESKIARDITAERVKRVAQGYTNAKGEKVEGLGGGFRFCELGEPLFDEHGQIKRPCVSRTWRGTSISPRPASRCRASACPNSP